MSTSTVRDRLAGNWQFPATNSSADFVVPYLVAKFRGNFAELDAALEDGVLTGSVAVSSINVEEPRLRGHLLSPDFFDAESHPRISFRSTILDIAGDTLTLDGELTIRGVTQPVHASGAVAGPVQDFLGHTRLGFTLETTIDRTDFGVSWNAELPMGGQALSDQVTLLVELEFHRA